MGENQQEKRIDEREILIPLNSIGELLFKNKRPFDTLVPELTKTVSLYYFTVKNRYKFDTY